jgi:hypothetical protein
MKQMVKLVLENTVSRRNPMAAALSEGQFRKRIVRSKKVYARKGRNNKGWE